MHNIRENHKRSHIYISDIDQIDFKNPAKSSNNSSQV